MQEFTSNDNQIHVQLHERFKLILSGAGTTGYLWEIEETEFLRIKEHLVDNQSDSFGAKGKDVFVLEALQKGEFEFTCELKRPWEKSVIKSLIFRTKVS